MQGHAKGEGERACKHDSFPFDPICGSALQQWPDAAHHAWHSSSELAGSGEGAGGGDHEGYGDAGGSGDGDGKMSSSPQRTPQSAQSVPTWQPAYSEPAPPSSQ